MITAIKFCVKIKQIMKNFSLNKILLYKHLDDKFPTIMADICKVTNFIVRMHTLRAYFMFKKFIQPSVRHCVKSVQIRSMFWSVFFCILTEYRKIRTKMDLFHAARKSQGFYLVTVS